MNIILLSTGVLDNKKEATRITELVRKGHFASVICKNHPNLPAVEKEGPISIYRRLPYQKHYFFENSITQFILPFRIMNYIEKKKNINFDIIHSFSSSPLGILSALLASKVRLRKRRLIHSIKSYSRNIKHRFFLSKILNYSDIITFPTKYSANLFISRGIKKSKTKIVYSLVDTTKFIALNKAEINKKKVSAIKIKTTLIVLSSKKNSLFNKELRIKDDFDKIISLVDTTKFIALNKAEIKKKYGFENKKVILYYGSMYGEKGIVELIKSIPLVTKNNPTCLFIIAPRSISKDDEQKFNDLNNVILLEMINVIDYLNLADIVCLPYLSLIATEGNPSCLLEAISCKTPVVTTNIPEIRELFIDRKDVLMAIPGNSIDLANKINFLFSNKKLQKELIYHSYKKSKDFDLKKITEKFIGCYTQ